jgi:hypothetical protein
MGSFGQIALSGRSRGTPKLREWEMTPVAGVMLQPRLMRTMRYIDARIRRLERTDPEVLRSPLAEEGSATELTLFPGVTKLFRPPSETWLVGHLGLPPAEQPPWEARVLSSQSVDPVHFAEVMALARLSGFEVYVGDGKALARFMGLPPSSVGLGSALAGLNISEAPLVVLDVGKEYSEIDYEGHVGWLRGSDLYGRRIYHEGLRQRLQDRDIPMPEDFMASGLLPFFSPEAVAHIHHWLFAGQELKPVDVLGLVPDEISGTLVAQGYYARSHLDRSALVDSDLSGSTGTTQHDNFHGLEGSGYHPLVRRGVGLLQRHFLQQQAAGNFFITPGFLEDWVEFQFLAEGPHPEAQWEGYLGEALLNPGWGHDSRLASVLRDPNLHTLLENSQLSGPIARVAGRLL